MYDLMDGRREEGRKGASKDHPLICPVRELTKRNTVLVKKYY